MEGPFFGLALRKASDQTETRDCSMIEKQGPKRLVTCPQSHSPGQAGAGCLWGRVVVWTEWPALLCFALGRIRPIVFGPFSSLEPWAPVWDSLEQQPLCNGTGTQGSCGTAPLSGHCRVTGSGSLEATFLSVAEADLCWQLCGPQRGESSSFPDSHQGPKKPPRPLSHLSLPPHPVTPDCLTAHLGGRGRRDTVFLDIFQEMHFPHLVVSPSGVGGSQGPGKEEGRGREAPLTLALLSGQGRLKSLGPTGSSGAAEMPVALETRPQGFAVRGGWQQCTFTEPQGGCTTASLRGRAHRSFQYRSFQCDREVK